MTYNNFLNIAYTAQSGKFDRLGFFQLYHMFFYGILSIQIPKLLSSKLSKWTPDFLKWNPAAGPLLFFSHFLWHTLPLTLMDNGHYESGNTQLIIVEKIQAWAGFKPMTSAIPVQSSINSAITW